MQKGEDGYGRTIWIERKDPDGKPAVYYNYNSKGRLMKHTRTTFGYNITEAEYVRFGEDTQIVADRSPKSQSS